MKRHSLNQDSNTIDDLVREIREIKEIMILQSQLQAYKTEIFDLKYGLFKILLLYIRYETSASHSG